MDFYRRVTEVCKLVPEGKVASYGQIALLCEKPQNSRQVGYALNRRIIEEVPAYRIVNHSGYLSGASAFEQPDMQKLLLEEEGVETEYSLVHLKYRVDLKRYQWKQTVEDLQKIKTLFQTKDI